MMGLIKQKIKNAIFKLGYKIYPKSMELVPYANFANIVSAYENLLTESGQPIPENQNRIKLLTQLQGTQPTEAYSIAFGLAKTKNVFGDVCEFGVAQGETSAFIANEIFSGDKVLHLFDSFEGLSMPTKEDILKDDIFLLGSMEAYAGEMKCPEYMVRDRLNNISFPENRYVVHKGFIDKVFGNSSNLPRHVSFAYVDFDFYEPIILALEFLHKSTVEGSIIIVDDYDYFSTGAKTAVDEFLKEKNASSVIYECLIPDYRRGHYAIITRKV